LISLHKYLNFLFKNRLFVKFLKFLRRVASCWLLCCLAGQTR